MKEEKKNNTAGIILAVLALIIIIIVVIFLLMGKKYTISFSNVEGYSSVEVKKGNTLTRPKDPVKSGYKFVGWYYNDALFDFSTEITDDMTLEARFEADGSGTDTPTGDTVTVTFNTDGGNSIDKVTINKDSKINKPSNPVKEGYTFVEWQLNGKAYDFDTKVTKNITLKAVWKKSSSSEVEKPDDNTGNNNNGKLTVTFNSNGGSRVASQSVNSGSTVKRPTNPTRSGYTFTGWTLNGKTYNFSTKVTKSITLVANWKQNSTGGNSGNQGGNQGGNTGTNPTPTNYTVTFNTNGGSAVAAQTVASGQAIQVPANPTKDGYTFVGWTLNGNDYNTGNAVTGNITLVAKWKQNVYTYTVEAITDAMGATLQSKVRVYDQNNKEITAQVARVFNGGTNLGAYSSNYQAILVNNSDVNKINRVYYNGQWVTVVKK